MGLLAIKNTFASMKNALLIFLDENFNDVKEFFEAGQYTKGSLTEATTDAGITVADCLVKDGLVDKAQVLVYTDWTASGGDATIDLGLVDAGDVYMVFGTFIGSFSSGSAAGPVISKFAGTATIQWLNAAVDLTSISSIFTLHTATPGTRAPMVSGVFVVTGAGTLQIRNTRTTYYGTVTGTSSALTIIKLKEGA